MKKPLKIAAWAGTLLFLSSIVFSGLSSIAKPLAIFLPVISMLLSLVLVAFFYYGFIVLGRKFNNKLLTITSWLFIVMAVLLVIILLIVFLLMIIYLLPLYGMDQSQAQAVFNPFVEQNKSSFFGVMWGIIGLFLLYVILAGVLSILFGVGLLRLKKNVEYANIAGILHIIAGATFIILIGFFINFLAMIMDIVVLFIASEKFESEKIKK